MISNRILRSFTFRQVLLYTSLSMGSMVILLGFIYWATAGFMDRELDATIQEEILGLSEQYDSQGLVGLSSTIEDRVALNPRGPAIYLLTNRNLRPIVGNLNAWPGNSDAESNWTHFKIDWGHGAAKHIARARMFVLNGGLHLLVGRDVHSLEKTRKRILVASAWGLAITTVLSLGVGLIMSMRVMRRLESVNQTSLEIMEGDFSRRVPTVGSGDDFDKLAINLNRMLERIQALMSAVRQVSDNIAHDLRTPLTRLRTRLEQVRSNDTQSASEEIDQAIEDVEELLATFNALLRIARIEAASDKVSFKELDLGNLVRDVAELYGPVAAEKYQSLQVKNQGKVPVQGDRHLLFQALANLVENAIKYTPEGSVITLSANTTEPGALVKVADNGPGIPVELHEKVFQRFFRTDSSRSTPGSGLGLSLVRAIADLHHAHIELRDNGPGLQVCLQFGN